MNITRITYPSSISTNREYPPTNLTAEAEIIYELRPSLSNDFSIPVDSVLMAKIWFIRFSNRWSTRVHLLLNENSRIVTSKGEIYEFLDFPKLAMKLERTKIEKMLEEL